jgi:hypothetical protein
MKNIKKATLLMLLAAGLAAEVCAAPGGDKNLGAVQTDANLGNNTPVTGQERSAFEEDVDAPVAEVWINTKTTNAITRFITVSSKFVPALPDNRRITYFVLSKNSIGAAGASELAETLGKNKSLTHLDLRFNSIGDEGKNSLKTAIRGRTFKLLDW